MCVLPHAEDGWSPALWEFNSFHFPGCLTFPKPHIRYALHLKSHMATYICTFSLEYSLCAPLSPATVPHWYLTSLNHTGSSLKLYSATVLWKCQGVMCLILTKDGVLVWFIYSFYCIWHVYICCYSVFTVIYCGPAAIFSFYLVLLPIKSNYTHVQFTTQIMIKQLWSIGCCSLMVKGLSEQGWWMLWVSSHINTKICVIKYFMYRLCLVVTFSSASIAEAKNLCMPSCQSCSNCITLSKAGRNKGAD